MQCQHTSVCMTQLKWAAGVPHSVPRRAGPWLALNAQILFCTNFVQFVVAEASQQNATVDTLKCGTARGEHPDVGQWQLLGSLGVAMLMTNAGTTAQPEADGHVRRPQQRSPHHWACYPAVHRGR